MSPTLQRIASVRSELPSTPRATTPRLGIAPRTPNRRPRPEHRRGDHGERPRVTGTRAGPVCGERELYPRKSGDTRSPSGEPEVDMDDVTHRWTSDLNRPLSRRDLLKAGASSALLAMAGGSPRQAW